MALKGMEPAPNLQQ